MQALAGAGAMLNRITIADDDRSLFEDWYNFQHLPERVGIPGFRRARRWVDAAGSRDGRTRFLTIYETDDVDVLASAPYLRALDAPTDLTRRVVPLFAEFRRSACRVTAVCGSGATGRCVAVDLDPATPVPDGLTGALARLRDEHLLHLGSLYEPDAAIGAAKAATSEGRASATQQDAEAALLLLEPQPGVPATALLGALDLVPAADPEEYELLFELRQDEPGARR
ncbi:hypothetical protein WIS52_10510 [Pseudonocardia nematodicida]|uniref:PAS domain-containing protein n=1 Tax=Pseudonocardia nematodicida TaxID=1206997 RepID=A0ABV1K8V4_9PSEU